MEEESFEALLFGYFEQAPAPNPAYQDVRIQWIEGRSDVGALHILEKHSLTKTEVEEVIFQLPPEVQTKRHPEIADRTLFWGATGASKWVFVVCEDMVRDGVRRLTPITAYVPDDGEDYWEEYE